MAKHKSVLVGVRVVEAGRSRKCYHAPDHTISKGDICLEVKDRMAWKGYCADCARAMLQHGAHQIGLLQGQCETPAIVTEAQADGR